MKLKLFKTYVKEIRELQTKRETKKNYEIFVTKSTLDILKSIKIDDDLHHRRFKSIKKS